MADVLVYLHDSNLLVAHPAAGLSPAEVVAAVVPAGAPHRFVSADALPTDARYRDAWTANFDDEPCVVTIDAGKKAAIDAQAKIAEADSWMAEQIALGYTTADGFTLGLSPVDVTLLTGNYVLAKEAAAAGLPLPPVIDTDGVVHEVEDIEELTALMLAYGQHRAALSVEYAALKAAASN